jgi:hypothetical protein
MDEWTPVLALPNLDMRGTLECPYAAIVAPSDPRVEKLRNAHPKLTTFLSKFSGQFREHVWPSLLLLRADAPQSYYTAEAVAAFRDVLSLSVVPYARTTRLRFNRASGLAFTNTFQFYPWMLDKQFEDMILINPAQMHLHVLEEFKGQAFPEQSQASIMWNDIDIPLARELLNRWIVRFSGKPVAWKDKALFRSLNMANEAGRIPALAASVFYDTGRSLALWVSAYEILAHPGGAGQSNFGTVSGLLESVKWHDPKLAAATHAIPGRAQQQRQLATWVCRKVYDLRNDFLHGNDVDGPALLLNGKPVIDFAACLYRLSLTGFLGLHFNVAMPSADQTEAVAQFIGQRRDFMKFQSAYESAISAAI